MDAEFASIVSSLNTLSNPQLSQQHQQYLHGFTATTATTTTTTTTITATTCCCTRSGLLLT